MSFSSPMRRWSLLKTDTVWLEVAFLFLSLAVLKQLKPANVKEACKAR